jgi:hypothetical protein
MNIELSKKEFRRLLDLVYIGNWVLNSIREDDRFEDYDELEEKIFSLCRDKAWNRLYTLAGSHLSVAAYQEGGIHEAIATTRMPFLRYTGRGARAPGHGLRESEPRRCE